jgi:hypothetical protein
MNSERRVVVVSPLYTLSILDSKASAAEIRLIDLERGIGKPPVPLYYDDNQDLSNQPDVILIPMCMRGMMDGRKQNHVSLAIYDREEDEILHFDSNYMRHGLRDRLAVEHAVYFLTGRSLAVRLHHPMHKQFNTQGSNDPTCCVHVIRNAESWLFNNRQLYTPDLDISQQWERLAEILKQLAQETLPKYAPPLYGRPAPTQSDDDTLGNIAGRCAVKIYSNMDNECCRFRTASANQHIRSLLYSHFLCCATARGIRGCIAEIFQAEP